MGCLKQLQSGERLPLASETLVGRSPRADLWIDESFVSRHHASLLWRGRWWELRDLGSHNGTAVNGQAVPTGTSRRLGHGDQISFGRASAMWSLVEDGGPEPFARSEDRRFVVGQTGLLSLPSPTQPELSVFQTSLGRWSLESAEQTRSVEDLELVTVAGRTWILRLPVLYASTRGAMGARALSLEEAQLRLRPAEVGLIVEAQLEGERFSFPMTTAPGLLVLLASARASSKDDGWLARRQVLETLSISANHLNVVVHRIRQHFADAGFTDGAHIVERQRGRIRLGCARVRLATAPESLRP